MGLGTPKVEQRFLGEFHFGTPIQFRPEKQGCSLVVSGSGIQRALDLYLGCFYRMDFFCPLLRSLGCKT